MLFIFLIWIELCCTSKLLLIIRLLNSWIWQTFIAHCITLSFFCSNMYIPTFCFWTHAMFVKNRDRYVLKTLTGAPFKIWYPIEPVARFGCVYLFKMSALNRLQSWFKGCFYMYVRTLNKVDISSKGLLTMWIAKCIANGNSEIYMRIAKG